MNGVRIVVAVVAMSISPAFAADQTIPLAAMTCKQFVDSPKDTIGVILTWMMGYLQDEDEPAEINFTKMEELGQKLGAYCGQNPTHGVMTALDKVSDASDSSDALKSVVGVWTFPDTKVWIVVRQDGSATQCRIAPDGDRLLLEGRVPRAGHSCLGEDLGRRQGRPREGCHQATGKFGTFSYKLDKSGGPSDRCAAT